MIPVEININGLMSLYAEGQFDENQVKSLLLKNMSAEELIDYILEHTTSNTYDTDMVIDEEEPESELL